MFCKKKKMFWPYLTPELRNSNWTGARRRTTVRRRFFGCAVQLFKNGFLGLIVGQVQDGSGPDRPACVPGLVCSTLGGLLGVSFTCDRVFFLFCQSENHLRTSSDWESVHPSHWGRGNQNQRRRWNVTPVTHVLSLYSLWPTSDIVCSL